MGRRVRWVHWCANGREQRSVWGVLTQSAEGMGQGRDRHGGRDRL